MFKVGDTVKLKADSSVAAGQFSRNRIYIVCGVRDQSLIIKADDAGRQNGWGKDYFELVRPAGESIEERLEKKMNPAIEEYTKTVTVRKIRPQSTIQLEHKMNVIKGIKQKNEIIVEAGYKGVLLKTRGCHSYECFADAEGLRTLAKQLTEIADVLDEGANS